MADETIFVTTGQLDGPAHKYNAFFQLKEKASYDQTGHPSRAGSVWLGVVLSLAKLTHSTCGLTNYYSAEKLSLMVGALTKFESHYHYLFYLFIVVIFYLKQNEPKRFTHHHSAELLSLVQSILLISLNSVHIFSTQDISGLYIV